TILSSPPNSTTTLHDALPISDFQQLNQRMVQSIQGRHSGTAATPPDSPHPPPQTVTTPEQINVTSDSAPGWLPSADQRAQVPQIDRKSTRLNSSHLVISYAVF